MQSIYRVLFNKMLKCFIVEQIEIDLEHSCIRTPEGEFCFEPYPEYVRGLVESGGIIPYTREKLRRLEEKRRAEG